MENLIDQLFRNEEIFFVLVITGAIVIVSITKAFFGTITKLARERTRREIAAYIPEGSMTPEQGEQILSPKKNNNGSCGCG